MATTYLTRQISSAGSRKKATISLWVKRGSGFGNDQRFFSYENTSVSNNVTVFKFSGDSIQFADQTGGSNNARYDGTRKLRDPNAWYHFLVKMDTTQATNTDRLKIYINGELQSEASYTYPTQNADLNIGHNANAYIDIGRWRGSNNQYFDGCISHFHYTDGYAYDASTFGSTDATTGEWIINTSPSITMGTNGFTILKDGNTITDQSTNSNNFTLGGGSLTDTPDCPSNIFANFDNLTPYHGTNFLGHERANTRTGTNSGVSYLNLLPNKGKWFVEYRINTAGAGQDNGVGFWSVMEAQTYAFYQTDFRGIVWKYAGNVYVDGVNNSFSSDTFTSGDIISIAMDFDNDQATFYKNGTVATNLNNYSYNFSNHFVISTGILDGATASAEDGIFDLNAGQNPTFGGRATAGTNADANGHGLFSMAVPSGYYAICTKNIKLYGG